MYRGRLRQGGQPVAVKVQRPGVREQIALDVYILRNLLSYFRQWRKVNRCLAPWVPAHCELVPHGCCGSWQTLYSLAFLC